MGLQDSKNPLLDQLRRMATLQQLRHMPDRELLALFAGQGNEAAFRALMDRYGPMVLRVCKRILGNDHDAEDAYQAVFLVLTSKSGSQHWQDSVAGWLHGVAVRVARKARLATQRRHAHEHQAPEKTSSDPLADLSMREAFGLLDEEMARLPEKYRLPLIQCQLMDRRQEEVARELGCSPRTLRLRLEQGKKRLRKQLAARGVTITGIMLSLMLSPGSEAAVVPPVLAADTLRAVLLFASGQQAVAASPAAIHLAGQAIKGMFLTQVRNRVLGVVLALVLAGGGVGAWQVYIHESAPANEFPATGNAAPVVRGKVAGPEAPAKVTGPTAFVRGKILDAAGHPVPFAAVTALARKPFRPGEHGLRDEVVARGQADEQGAFRLRVAADFPTWFPNRQVVLLAAAPGHAPATAIVPLMEHNAAEVALRLTAANGAVGGQLLGPDGAAAAGVRLRVIRLGDVAREPVQGAAEDDTRDLAWPAPFVSDVAGRFTLRGIDPAQGAWLQVDDDRYVPDAFRLGGHEPEPVIKLKPAHVIEGRVIAADTGLPLVGVRLTVRDHFPKCSRLAVADYQGISARSDPLGPIDGVTGADGRFRFYPLARDTTFLEIHPAAGSPYLAVFKRLAWPDGLVRQTLTVALPRGVVVRGRVVDQNGKPVAGAALQFESPTPGNSAYRLEVIQGSFQLFTSGPDGRFRMTTPTGPVCIRAHGPTHEFRPQVCRRWVPLGPDEEKGRWGWREPLPGENGIYAHAEEVLESLPSSLQEKAGVEKESLSSATPEVQLRMTRGKSVTGRLLGPDGQPVQTAVLLCVEKVSPLLMYNALPLPVGGGRYELPGCTPGRVYPVFLLDVANGHGAALDVTAGSTAGPDVRLAPCGSVRVRVVDAQGRPAARKQMGIFLLAEPSFRAIEPPIRRQTIWQLASWYDPVHYADIPQCDGDGWLMLPALIPSARYLLYDSETKRQSQPFTVKEGEQKQLPDIVLETPPRKFPDAD